MNFGWLNSLSFVVRLLFLTDHYRIPFLGDDGKKNFFLVCFLFCSFTVLLAIYCVVGIVFFFFFQMESSIIPCHHNTNSNKIQFVKSTEKTGSINALLITPWNEMTRQTTKCNKKICKIHILISLVVKR